MYTRPLWDPQSRLVYGESGLFKGSEGVKLLFPAEEILHLYNPSLEKEYLPGVHFNHTPGSDLITPVSGSGICGLGPDGIFPAPETAILFPKPGANAIGGGPDGKLVIFDNAHFFAYHQFNVDYRAVKGTVFPEIPVPAAPLLPRCRAALKAGKTINAILIGDSISEGYNATEFVKVPPFAPPYFHIFVQKLMKKFHTHINARNGAIGGTGCRHAFSITSRWLEAPCDLLVIAYGMNDLNAMTPEEYKDQLRRIMDAKRAVHPETEFILVAPMTRNPIWLGESLEISRRFAEVLQELVSPSCAVADVFTLWTKILEKKDFYDLTGNGVNHPNDYGHRIYSAVLENIFNI
ncbi:MAG: SGNH/GDSL hydrolase family protein [Lentisphaeria bacterium]|nr:SGNH/GDSL hydrolase family protein [Lentisphaeria bacterium]